MYDFIVSNKFSLDKVVEILETGEHQSNEMVTIQMVNSDNSVNSPILYEL